MNSTSELSTASLVLGREREASLLHVALDQLLEAGLVDRDLAAFELRDLLRVDVGTDHLHAELGEARPGDEADVAGADHSDVHE